MALSRRVRRNGVWVLARSHLADEVGQGGGVEFGETALQAVNIVRVTAVFENSGTMFWANMLFGSANVTR